MKKFFTLSLSVLLGAMAYAATPRIVSEKGISLREMSEREIAPVRLTNQMKQADARTLSASTVEESVEWTEWEDFGDGVLHLDDALQLWLGIEGWEGDFSSTTDVRHQVGNDKIMQFRLNKVFNDVDIVVDWNAETGIAALLPQSTGIDFDGVPLLIVDAASAFRVIRPDYMSDEEIEACAQMYEEYNYYIPDLGRLYLYVGYYVEGLDDLLAVSDINYQWNGAIDFTPAIEANRYYNQDTPMVAKISVNEGVADVRYGILPGLADRDKLMSIANDSEASTPDAEGEISINVDGNGYYTIFAVTYNAEGEAMEASSKSFTYCADENDQWTSLGMTDFCPDFIESIFSEADPETYKVEIQESNSAKGLYRLVNPFGGEYSFNGAQPMESGINHYMVVDATDPDMVIIPVFDMGISIEGQGFIAMTESGYYQQCGLEGKPFGADACGHVEENVITFPSDKIFVGCDDWTVFGGQANALYHSNSSAKCSIVIPEQVGIENIEAVEDIDAPVEYINLQGIKVQNAIPGQLLLRRQGPKVEKVMVK